jgi:hypothetical protein
MERVHPAQMCVDGGLRVARLAAGALAPKSGVLDSLAMIPLLTAREGGAGEVRRPSGLPRREALVRIRLARARFRFRPSCSTVTFRRLYRNTTASFQIPLRIAGFDVFAPVTMKNAVFWDVALCKPCNSRRFGGTCRFHLQLRRNDASGEA